MAMIQIGDFGGRVPAVSPRRLPAGAAQTNDNLLATSNEFRPLRGDKDIAAAPTGAVTLYRLSRNSDGTLRTGDTTGWIAETRDKSYVKGQLNDDATERTVVSFNDGVDVPRVIDATGENRQLGVPAPTKPTVVVGVETVPFTMDDAITWVEEDVLPAVEVALLGSLYEDDIGSRYRNGAPVAGSYGMHGMSHYAPKPWNAVAAMSNTLAEQLGLKVPRMGWEQIDPSTVGFKIELMPYWGVIDDASTLEQALRDVESPKDGTQVFSEGQISELSAKLQAAFDPDDPSIKHLRNELEAVAKEFAELIAGANASAQGPRPVEPTKPTGPEWEWDPASGGHGG